MPATSQEAEGGSGRPEYCTKGTEHEWKPKGRKEQIQGIVLDRRDENGRKTGRERNAKSVAGWMINRTRKAGGFMQEKVRLSHSLLPQTLLSLLIQEARPWFVVPVGAWVAAIIGRRGGRSEGGVPRCRGPLSRAWPRAGAVGLVPGALAEATRLMAEAIPIPGPRAGVRARAAAPRGAGGFAGLRALRGTATLPPGAQGFPLRAARTRHRSHQCRWVPEAGGKGRALASLGRSRLYWLPEPATAPQPEPENTLETVPGTSSNTFPGPRWSCRSKMMCVSA